MRRSTPAIVHYARRRAARMLALLFAAQLALLAHAIGHDYTPDADQAHVVCSLCVHAHQLDHGLAAATLELPPATLSVPAIGACRPSVARVVTAVFLARAPPHSAPA